MAGRVEAILIAATATELPHAVDSARLIAGAGTFSDGTPDGRALTLVEAEVLDDLGLEFAAARRNIVTRGIELNLLVGERFMLGEVKCQGRRLCEPCAHLDRLAGPGLLTPLAGRGGLRADIVGNGRVAVGAAIARGQPPEA